MESTLPLTFGIAEASSFARVGLATLYAAIKNGELWARKVGKQILLVQDAL